MGEAMSEVELEALVASLSEGEVPAKVVIEQDAPTVDATGAVAVGIKAKVDIGDSYVAQLKEDVRVDALNLDDALMNHASMFVHYATQTVSARRKYERTKVALEILEAQLDARKREEAASDGKKTTEALIRNLIVSDPQYAAMTSRLIEAQAQWRLCEVAESAFVQRKDLILEVARDRRKEKEGQLRVLEETQSRDKVVEMLKNKAKA